MKKRILGLVLAAAMLITSVTAPAPSAEAAKLPKLSKKNVSINVGEKTKISVKYGNKKAKVSWKTSKKSVAKIAKKTSSGNKAYAQISGVKAGKAKITASYKLAKKTKKLICTVKVLKDDTEVTASPSAQATASATATSQPATQTPIVTVAPTAVPATTAPTEVPASPTPIATDAPSNDDIWVSTWANAEEKANSDANSMPPISLNDTSYRQVVRVTTGGNKIRFKFSNQYGKTDLELKSTHIAKQVDVTKSDIDPATDTVVTFNEGEESVSIAPGEVVVSDPVEFSVEALENIAVTTLFGETPEIITSHRGARATQYLLEGDHVSDETFANAKTTKSWYYLCDISILSPANSAAVVCFGDSITDGYGTDADYLGKKPDSYTRWGDYFAKRLKENEKTANISVLNEGIGANSMMGNYPTDAGKDRFKRDLLEHDGVKYCIILFGVNDLNKLSNTDKLKELLPEYEKMVALCHENGIKVYGAPILPFGTSDYYSEASESVRTSINTWMKSDEAGFDGIIDFESALIDPNAEIPSILEQYTHTDGLHPYDGYDVMANAIDLKLFE